MRVARVAISSAQWLRHDVSGACRWCSEPLCHGVDATWCVCEMSTRIYYQAKSQFIMCVQFIIINWDRHLPIYYVTSEFIIINSVLSQFIIINWDLSKSIKDVLNLLYRPARMKFKFQTRRAAVFSCEARNEQNAHAPGECHAAPKSAPFSLESSLSKGVPSLQRMIFWVLVRLTPLSATSRLRPSNQQDPNTTV